MQGWVSCRLHACDEKRGMCTSVARQRARRNTARSLLQWLSPARFLPRSHARNATSRILAGVRGDRGRLLKSWIEDRSRRLYLLLWGNYGITGWLLGKAFSQNRSNRREGRASILHRTPAYHSLPLNRSYRVGKIWNSYELSARNRDLILSHREGTRSVMRIATRINVNSNADQSA